MSKLFTMFIKGCEKRMDRLVKQDLGLSLEVLQAILQMYEEELNDPNVLESRKQFVVMCVTTFVILWAGVLQGGDVFMLEASEFFRHRDDERDSEMNGHVVIPLMGRFKNETGERNLLLVLANVTQSGLDIRKCVCWKL